MEFRLTLTGTAPLIMHNGRLASTLDPASKAVKQYTSKRKKTDQDYDAIAQLEFHGGLYIDPDVGPYVPGENVQRMCFDAAKMSRRGQHIKRGLFIHTNINPIAYNGPRTADGLWDDENFRFIRTVVVAGKRVPRSRPVFTEWLVAAEGTLDESQLNFSEFADIVEQGGAYVGLGDWRPRYGRFTADLERIKQ